jgi:hypothetical protein
MKNALTHKVSLLVEFNMEKLNLIMRMDCFIRCLQGIWQEFFIRNGVNMKTFEIIDSVEYVYRVCKPWKRCYCYE